MNKKLILSVMAVCCIAFGSQAQNSSRKDAKATSEVKPTSKTPQTETPQTESVETTSAKNGTITKTKSTNQKVAIREKQKPEATSNKKQTP